MYKPPREVADIKVIYDTNVKPIIEQGNYELAILTMGNMIELARMKQTEIMTQTHCGAIFLASIQGLEKALESGDADRISSAQKRFEAYAAQTSVPGEQFST